MCLLNPLVTFCVSDRSCVPVPILTSLARPLWYAGRVRCSRRTAFILIPFAHPFFGTLEMPVRSHYRMVPILISLTQLSLHFGHVRSLSLQHGVQFDIVRATLFDTLGMSNRSHCGAVLILSRRASKMMLTRRYKPPLARSL